jgi:uncharacterized protein
VSEPLAAPFLAAAAEGRLVVQVCRHCGTAHLPPRACCESCARTAFEWRPAAGTGRLAAFSVLHRAPDGRPVPYVYALVELDEGPRMISNVAGCEPADVRVGMRLRAVFGEPDEDGRRWPRFEPGGG